MLLFRKYLILVVLVIAIPGCGLFRMHDPNYNDKIRYSMAHRHAARVLAKAGSDLDSHEDYNLMTYWRRHYDEKTRVIHDFKLYDFLKTSDKPGPERFVIAYDKHTRKTYLRSDLRSNENLQDLKQRE